MPRIVLDTDIGSDCDDAIALALALAAPELELAAITTVTGDTALRARIAAHLLALAGRPHVPVYAGHAEPLAGGAFVWFGHEHHLAGAPRGAVAPEPAAAALARCFDGRTPLELVAIGPLTNIAAALARDPALARRIPRLTLMGGYVRPTALAGHVVPAHVDYNLCGDPTAAQRVFTSGIPIRMVPIDVTVHAALTERDAAALAASAAPLAQAVARAVRGWARIQRDGFARLGVPLAPDVVSLLHDPLAIACTYDESFCTFEDLTLQPAMVDGLFRLLERPPGTPGTVVVRTATAVDPSRFLAHLRSRLGIM
jgi:purine nucleosidase